MSHLLAMSFDWAASPSIELRAVNPVGKRTPEPTGWGFAWYPHHTEAAVVIKDPTSLGENAMTQVLRDWNRFRSTIFVCHIRGAAKRITQQDTHPFCRSYAGRDWILAHNGDLVGDLSHELPLGEFPTFEPVGRTDSERVLCWMLTCLHTRRVRSLSDMGWDLLYTWFARLNGLGTANFIISDGRDLVVYQDREGFNSLHWIRRRPPHAISCLEHEKISLDLADPFDQNRTMVLFSTDPLSEEPWRSMQRGQMLVTRGGALVWDSHASYAPAEPRATRARPLTVPLPDNTGSEPVWVGSGQLRAASPLSPVAAVRSMLARSIPAPQITRQVRVVHETIYRYESPVERSRHVLRLRPVQDDLQHVLDHRLSISTDGWRQEFEDVFGNHAVAMDIEAPYTEMRLRSESSVLITTQEQLSVNFPARRHSLPLVWMPWQRQMMLPYLLPPELPETQLRELSDFAMSFVERQDADLIAALIDMNLTVYRDFAYISNSTNLATTPWDVFASRKGVCQDFANLLICLARLLDVPARYRVGYIYTGGDYENKVQSESSHAWAEVYLPGLGWRGFDPTNGCMVGADHVRVACGRNYRDATPTGGTIYKGGASEKLTVEVRVDLVEDEPAHPEPAPAAAPPADGASGVGS